MIEYELSSAEHYYDENRQAEAGFEIIEKQIHRFRQQITGHYYFVVIYINFQFSRLSLVKEFLIIPRYNYRFIFHITMPPNLFFLESAANLVNFVTRKKFSYHARMFAARRCEFGCDWI